LANHTTEDDVAELPELEVILKKDGKKRNFSETSDSESDFGTRRRFSSSSISKVCIEVDNPMQSEF